ncbi:MAG: transaldolase [Candidatus Omnitrophica bacterium]|nr:transaldolase [Candidatus Omnitrophota bacterium]
MSVKQQGHEGIFLDTGKLDEIKRFHAMGIIRGVTTNPSILLRDGTADGMDAIRRSSIEIAKLIAPMPLSVEVTRNDPEIMMKQALEFSGWAENINVKITIHGPQGELDNLRVVHELEHRHNVRINVTAMMSAQQCLAAAMAGASYVSLFGGRVNNMGYDSRQEVRRTRNLLDQLRLPSRIIVGSCREVLNIVEWFESGAHIVTAPPALIEGMIVHPYTKETVEMFLRDGRTIDKTSGF